RQQSHRVHARPGSVLHVGGVQAGPPQRPPDRAGAGGGRAEGAAALTRWLAAGSSLWQGPSMPFTIVAETCTGCTACEKRCPTKAISGDPKKAYYIEATLCIDCGACGVICPDEAILDTYGNVTKVLKRQERP